MSTHFERLGLPRRYAVDLDELERNYLARSRELHPDFHQQQSTAQQTASMELTAALNEAYATLKRPFSRAEYLLKLENGPTAADHKVMDPAFLEEMLELRMEIEELRSDRDSPQWKKMEQQLRGREEAIEADVARVFGRYETAADSKLLVQIRQALNAAKYIQGLLRDLRED